MNINQPHVQTPISRRSFIKGAGFAAASAAVLSSPRRTLAQAAPKAVTLAFVGVAHVHSPAFIKLLKSCPDV